MGEKPHRQSVSLIVPAALRRLLARQRDQILVIDARTAREYRHGHIPGALFAGWEEWCAAPPRNHHALLGRPGYWGVLDDSLSNGGAARGAFHVSVQSSRRVRLDDLKASYAARRFPVGIDTRTRHEHAGLTFPYMPRSGCLPASVLLPYEKLFESSGAYVDRRRYLELLPPDAWAAPGLFAYCEVGVRAATAALLHEVHTGAVLPVYDGSMMEWGLERALPLGEGHP